MANPIGYNDLFDGAGRDDVLKAIADIKALRKSYQDFLKSVTADQIKAISDAQRQLSIELQNVATSSSRLNVTNEAGQRALIDQLQLVQRLRTEEKELTEAKKGAKAAEDVLADSVEGLTKKLKEQMAEWKKLSSSADADKMQALGKSIGETRKQINDLNASTKATTTSFKAAKGSYEELDMKTKQLVIKLKQLEGGMGANSKEAKIMQKEIHANTTKLKEFDSQMNHNFRNVGNYKDALGGVNNVLGSLGLATISLGALVAGFNAIMEGAKRWQSLESGIRAVTDSEEEMAEVLDYLNVVADKYGQSIETLAGTYKGLAAATKGTSLEGRETKRIFESIVTAGTALKLSNEQVEGSLLAIQQMISKGKVSAEELRGQLGERLPGAFKMFADAAGMSTAELDKQLKAGTVLATDVLPKFASLLERTYSDKAAMNAHNLGNETERLGNAWLRFAGSFGEQSGILGFFATMKSGLATILTSITTFMENTSVKTFIGMFTGGNLRSNIHENERKAELARFKAANKEEREEMIKDADARISIQNNVLKQVDQQRLREINQQIEDSRKVKGTGGINRFVVQKDNAETKELRKQKAALLGGLTEEDIERAKKLKKEASDVYISYLAENDKLSASDKELQARRQKEVTEASADARAKAAAKADQAEKKRLAELERRRKEQDDLLQAAAKLEIAQAEHRFALSAQTAQDEIGLENQRLTILERSYDARLKLYRKDEKEYTAILTEREKAEADNAQKILQIRDKDFQQTAKLRVALLEGEYSARQTNYDEEVEFEQKRLAILLEGFNSRMTLYRTDSDEYRQLAADRVAAEQEAADRIKKIEEARSKGRAAVQGAQTGLQQTQFVSGMKTAVARGDMSEADMEAALHEQKMLQLQTEVTRRQGALLTLKEGDVAYYDNQTAMLDAQKALIDERTDYEIKKEEDVKNKKKELQQMALDFAINSAHMIADISAEINESRIEDLEKMRDKEIETVGSNAAAKEKIEEKYNQKVIALRRKQAIFDKAVALFDIGVNTAVSVMKTSAQLGLPAAIPFIVATIATGALQAAAVLAKPLPKYAKGRGKKQTGEFAVVNDAGWELIERDGTYRMEAGGRPTIANLHKDDVVHTHERSKRLLSEIVEKQEMNRWIDSLLEGTKVVRSVEENRLNRVTQAIVSSSLNQESLKNAFYLAIKRLPINNFVLDEQGWRVYETNVGGKVEHMNNRNKFGGDG